MLKKMNSANEVMFISADLADQAAGGALCDREIWEALRVRYRVILVEPYKLADLRWLPNATLRAVLYNLVLLLRVRPPAVVLVDLVYARELFIAAWIWRHFRRCTLLGLLYHLRYHLTERPLVKRFERFAETVTLRCLDHVWVISQSGRREAVALGVDPAKIALLPTAKRYRTLPVLPATPEPNRPITLLFVGTIQRRKGVADALRALSRYDGPDHVRFRCVGRMANDPPYVCELQRLAAACPRATVEWVGFVSDAQLEHEYAGADAFLFPSLWEGYGMAIEEAMLFGLPVICYATSAVTELAVDGRNAWVVPPGDVATLATAIKDCVTNPAERRRRGLQAAADARRRLAENRRIGEPIVAFLEALRGHATNPH